MSTVHLPQAETQATEQTREAKEAHKADDGGQGDHEQGIHRCPDRRGELVDEEQPARLGDGKAGARRAHHCQRWHGQVVLQ